MRTLMIATAFAALGLPVLAQDPDAPLDLPPVVMSTEHPGEIAVEPYERSNAHAGATPFEGAEMWGAFGQAEGVSRIVDVFMDLNVADPRIAGIFQGQDLVRVRRTLKEQFGYILSGPVNSNGPDIATTHPNPSFRQSRGFADRPGREPADRPGPRGCRFPRPEPVSGQAGPDEGRRRHPLIPQRNKSVAHRPCSGPR